MAVVTFAETTYAALTIDAAKQTDSVSAIAAETITYQTVASAASSPTGTTIQIQGSLDNANWSNIGSAVSVTGNGTFIATASTVAFKFYRLAYARSGGSYVATTSVLIKGRD